MSEARRTRAVVALGSNLGDKVQRIRRALDLLWEPGPVAIVARSRLYRTAPWGVTTQDWFVNACVAVETTLSARALLDRCLGIEEVLGRRRIEKWGPREIDLDVITYGDETIDEPGLTLPHPHMLERAFVLVPLIDVAPDTTVRGITARDALARLGASDVVPLEA